MAAPLDSPLDAVTDGDLQQVLRQHDLSSWSLLAALLPADAKAISTHLSPESQSQLTMLLMRARTHLLANPGPSSIVLPTESITPVVRLPGPAIRQFRRSMVFKSRRMMRRSFSLQSAVLSRPTVLQGASSSGDIWSFVEQGLEPSTRYQYSLVERLYLSSVPTDEQGFPLTGPSVVRFVMYLSKAGYAPSTISTYSRCLRAVNSYRGGSLSPSETLLIQGSLRTARKRYDGSFDRKAKVFSAVHLENLAAFDDDGLVPIDVPVAGLVAVFALLRSEEVLNLNLGDVRFTLSPPKLSMALTIKRSKTDGAAVGHEVTVACITNSVSCTDKLCPMHRLFHVVRSRMGSTENESPRDLPLFVNRSGCRLTYSAFLDGIRVVTGDPSVSTHSCRRTGSHLMARSGLSVDQIRDYGRWNSDAVLGYLQGASLGDASSYASLMATSARRH